MSAEKGKPVVDPKDLLPEQDAAREIHQKPATLMAWRVSGKGPAFYKVGRRCFYRREDLIEWVSSRRREPRKTETARRDA